MNKDITIAGNTYQDVPFISAPSGDELANFYEISDTTATQSDVKIGKYFYSADGEKLEGTHQEEEPSYETPTINVSSGGLITATANGVSNTSQLSTQSAKTVTPTTSEQTAVASGKYTTGIVKVGAIPSQYIIPSGSQTITENGTVDVTSLASVIVNVATGGGGLPTGISKIAYGTYSVTSAFTTTRQTVTHNLGVTPDLVFFFHDSANGNIAQTYSMLWSLRCTKLGYRSSAYNLYNAYHGNSTTSVSISNSSSTSVGVSNMTATTFQIASHSTSYYWRGGYTYKWVAIKFA